MIVLGLTGSIAMGKSTTAKMFAGAGVAIHDADATVHSLYAGRAAPLIERAFPGSVLDGVVDRARLSARVLGKAAAMAELEGIIHPLVQEEETAFLERCRKAHVRVAMLDIPLLFETGADRRVRATVLVTAPARVQRQRALSRPGMTGQRLKAILDRQLPDIEKRHRAHFIVDTGRGMGSARRSVMAIVHALAFMA